MLLTEMESLQDLAAGARRAAADIDVEKGRLAEKEKALGSATAEVSRLYALQGQLTSRAGTLAERAKTARILALQGVAAGLDMTNPFGTWRKLRTERDDLVSSLSYLVSFLIPAAERVQRLAEIEERSQAATTFESIAVGHRLRAAVIAAEAAEFDPGISLGTDQSFSAQNLARAADIRRQVTELKKQLVEFDARTQKEQDLVAPGLLN